MNLKPVNKRKFGYEKETLAAQFLKSNGVRILHRNFQCRLGEIDLIGQHLEYLIFVEVRYRANNSLVSPIETVDKIKQTKLIRCANYYLATKPKPDKDPCRFDVIGIVGGKCPGEHHIQWIQNAFDT